MSFRSGSEGVDSRTSFTWEHLKMQSLRSQSRRTDPGTPESGPAISTRTSLQVILMHNQVWELLNSCSTNQYALQLRKISRIWYHLCLVRYALPKSLNHAGKLYPYCYRQKIWCTGPSLSFPRRNYLKFPWYLEIVGLGREKRQGNSYIK